MQLFRVLVLALCTVLIAFSPAAEAAFTAGGTDPLTVIITPQYPRPYDTFTITPQSSLIDLSSTNITISVNGTVVEQGSGSHSTSAQVGGPGSTTTVRVSAKDVDGQVYTQQIVLRPADVALIIDPVSTSHPFYEGAALVAPEGRVRLVAIPDFRTSTGAIIPTSSLVYTWKNGDQVLLDQSGIGRSVLDAVAPVRYRDANISLVVSTQDKSINASASAVVSPVDPIVRVYRTSPLLGPSYEQALSGSVAMDDTEDSFRAVPYFFKNDNLSLAWTVNGVQSETSKDITVRITDPGSGSAHIGVTARESDAARSAQTAFTLTFGSEGGGGIFGL